MFPYAIKGTLEFLLLKGGDDSCFTKIIGINTVAGTRFRFQGSGEPSVEDPNGDSCIWEEARRGDMFYMMRVGDDKAGIVFSGQFVTDPYPADDWGGSTKRRMYVDMVCMNAAEPDAAPLITLEELQKTIQILSSFSYILVLCWVIS